MLFAGKRKVRWLAVLLSVAMLAACGPDSAMSPTGASPALPAAAEPAKLVSGDTLSIGIPIPDDNNAARYEDYIDRLQKLLFGVGWKVQLSALRYKVASTTDEEDPLLMAIRAQAAANRAPDAWHVWSTTAQLLRQQGLTRDMADILPAAAPMLWQGCKGAFADGAVPGAPMSLLPAGEGSPIALLMSTVALNSYGQPIANADGLLAYLEQTSDTAVFGEGRRAAVLYDAWAAQQGYYALTMYGFPDFLYARQDDPDCTIVPIEDIPGFDAFFLRSVNLGLQGRLPGMFGDPARATGMLVHLGKGADHQVQAYLKLMGKDITALPLAGCIPVQALEQPIVQTMLAANANSPQADAVAAFAQWALMDPEGYDLCTLGQSGVDYRMVEGRVEYLAADTTLAPIDWRLSMEKPPFCLYEGSFVSNSGLRRFTVYEAANAEQLLAAYRSVTPPLHQVASLLHNPYSQTSPLAEARQLYQDVRDLREKHLLFMVGSTNGVPEFTPEQALQQLRHDRPLLDPCLASAQVKIRQLLEAGQAGP